MDRGVGRVARRVLRAVDAATPHRRGLTVLIYHRVGGGSASAVDLAPDVFDRQLAALAADHRVISLDAALGELRTGESRPGVVITFDDGTADFAEHAMPALVRHGLPATLYVATRFVQEQADFPWGAPPTTWAALRDAHTTGLLTVGSHSHAHRLFDRSTAGEAADDLDRSIDLIGGQLGVRPAHFAYPKAVAPGPVGGGRGATPVARAPRGGNRVNRAGHTDPQRLGRSPVRRGDSLADVHRLAAGGMRPEGLARDVLGRVRYRGAVT